MQWAYPDGWVMVGKVTLNTEAGSDFSLIGIGLQCSVCYAGIMAIWSQTDGAMLTIKYEEQEIYDDGQIDAPDFITNPTELKAPGSFSGPAGNGEEWG